MSSYLAFSTLPIRWAVYFLWHFPSSHAYALACPHLHAAWSPAMSGLSSADLPAAISQTFRNIYWWSLRKDLHLRHTPYESAVLLLNYGACFFRSTLLDLHQRVRVLQTLALLAWLKVRKWEYTSNTEGRGHAPQTIDGSSCFRNSAGALARFTFLTALFNAMRGRSCTCDVCH